MESGTEVRVVFHTKKVVDAIEDAAAKRMLEAVQEIRNTVMETLSGTRSGKIYKVPGTNRSYVASAPGEPPAQATGRLRQSVQTSIEGEGKKIVGTVGTKLKYGRELEFGSRGRNLLPRPWLKPSFEKSKDKVKEILEDKWF